MKKIIFVLLLLKTVVFINAVDVVRDYEDQISFIFNLSNKFTIHEIGTINYSENKYSMYKLTYNNNISNKRYLVISGIHGIEVAPIYAIKDYIIYLDTKETIEDLTIDFIYILNPYGFEYNWRYNGRGYDLNRDFINMENQEIQILISNTKDTQYAGMYDFHEADSKGFFLYYYAGRSKKMANSILNNLKNENVYLDNEYVDVILKAKDGLIYIPFYAKFYYMTIKKWATTGLYFDKLNVENVFVFETPVGENIETRKRTINLILKYLFG
jgi:hypothetical protein